MRVDFKWISALREILRKKRITFIRYHPSLMFAAWCEGRETGRFGFVSFKANNKAYFLLYKNTHISSQDNKLPSEPWYSS